MKHFFDNKGRVGAASMLVFAIVYLNIAMDLPTDPLATDEHFTSKTMPLALAWLMMISCVIKLLIPVNEENHESIKSEVDSYNWKPSIWLVVIMSVYSLCFDYLGFIVATTLLLLTGFVALGERNLAKGSAIGFILTFSIWAILTQLFGLHLNAGELYYSVIGADS